MSETLMNTQPPPRIVLAGASGFIGNATLLELHRRKRRVVGFARGSTRAAGNGIAQADLLEPASLDGMIDRGDAVIHTAPYIGRDAARSAAVNIAGTRNLVHAARRAGAAQVIYVSTTAVYGMGPHRNLRPEDAAISPMSVVSEHRRVAEEIVLDAGGTVVRPHLVYGVGDVWVIPAFLAMPRLLGGIVNGGSALASLISVDTLARLLIALTDLPPETIAGRCFHAVHPAPMTVRDITTRASEAFGAELPIIPVALRTADEIAARSGFSAHQLDLAATDHWYNGDDLWSHLEERELTAFTLTDAQRDWYAAAQ